MREKGSPVTNRSSRRLLWPILVLVALAAGLAVSCGGGASGGNDAGGAQTGTEETRAGAETAGAGLGAPSLGEEDAPVVITEYADYQ